MCLPPSTLPQPTSPSPTACTISAVRPSSHLACPLCLPRDEHKEFRVNRVFDPSSTQDAVYEDTQPLVRSVLDGERARLRGGWGEEGASDSV